MTLLRTAGSQSPGPIFPARRGRRKPAYPVCRRIDGRSSEAAGVHAGHIDIYHAASPACTIGDSTPAEGQPRKTSCQVALGFADGYTIAPHAASLAGFTRELSHDMSQASIANLSGRIAVISGASSGIGHATASLLAAQGAKVALLARRKAKLDELAGKIAAAGGKAMSLAVDVTDQAAVAAASRQISEQFGTVDLVVNNAGVMLPNPIEDLRHDQWNQQVDLNIKGLMNVIGAFVPDLVAAAGKGGPADLVNISSIAAQNIFANFAVYCATKAYVTHLSRNLRAELGPKNVRVSAIEPGIVGTELQDHVDFKAVRDWLEGSKDSIDWLAAEDIAEMIAFTVGLPKHVNLQQVTIMPTRQPM